MRSWVDPLVPAELHRDADALRRAQLTVLLSTVLIVAAAAYALFYGFVVRFVAGAVITAAGAVIAALVLAALHVLPRLRAGGHALTGVLYSVIVGIVCYSGGVPSPVTPWLIMPPTFAALLLGRRGAAGWAVLSVLTIGALELGARHGVHLPTDYGIDWERNVTLGSFVGLVASSTVLLFVFESQWAAAHARAEAASAALARLAYHDALTGLTNRARFFERVGEALAACAGSAPLGATVLLVDLDGFKAVNDSMGHAAGDALLVVVAQRLLSATRGCDTVARLGGDEFAVLVAGVREEASAAIVAERILGALAAPFSLAAGTTCVSGSIGIAHGIAPAGADTAHEVARLLHDADVAMYRAKALGKGRWVRFSPALLEAAARSALPGCAAPGLGVTALALPSPVG